MTSHKQHPIVIVGGGIIGLAVGWQLRRRGRAVAILERDTAGRGASWVAAGMLAPHSEVGFEDDGFLEIGLESLRAYRTFLEELAEDCGRELSLDDRGTLLVAFNRDDAERIRRLYDYRRQIGLPVTWQVGSEIREIEPALSPRVTAAIRLPDDSQVNNRELIDALKVAFLSRGGDLREHTLVTAINVATDGTLSVQAGDDTLRASAVVVAAGCWSRDIAGIPQEFRPPVRPVKGQVVSLKITADFTLSHVVRAPDVYILPKDDGRVVIGATQEEMGFDTSPTAGPIMRLLERAWEAVPSIYDLPIDAIEVGLRPGSRDHLPIVGKTPIEGLYFATGHFRHGILLAPLTAYLVRDLVADGKQDPLLARLAPARFGTRKQQGHRVQ